MKEPKHWHNATDMKIFADIKKACRERDRNDPDLVRTITDREYQEREINGLPLKGFQRLSDFYEHSLPRVNPEFKPGNGQKPFLGFDDYRASDVNRWIHELRTGIGRGSIRTDLAARIGKKAKPNDASTD